MVIKDLKEGILYPGKHDIMRSRGNGFSEKENLMSMGLKVTIGVFVLAGIFGLILLADAKRARKASTTEKTDTTPAKKSVPVSAGEVKSEPESWRKSAERFRRKSTDN
jgi:hypothetical protein